MRWVVVFIAELLCFVIATAAAIFVAGTILVLAARLETTIAIETQTADSVTFTVTRSAPDDRDLLYVLNECEDEAGNQTERLSYPVLWGTTVSLTGTTWPFPTSGVACHAQVTLRPWTEHGIGETLEYSP